MVQSPLIWAWSPPMSKQETNTPMVQSPLIWAWSPPVAAVTGGAGAGAVAPHLGVVSSRAA